jgi:hypothetical protein
MVLDEEHCFSITHVRHFMAKTSSSMQMSLHNFCDICTYTTCDSVNRAKMNEHFTKCLETNACCRNSTLVQFEENTVVTPKPFSREKWIHCEECGTDKFGDKRSQACTQNDHTITKYTRIKCNVCKFYVEDDREASTHLCFISPPKIKDAIPNSKLYVYDIEAMQFEVGELIQGNRATALNAYQHECNLVCLRPMYQDLENPNPQQDPSRITFDDIDVFCDHIFNSDEFEDAVIIAHNGGGYDHQYVLQYCEKRAIPHRTTPHPASKHRFLCLEMTAANGTSRKFIDSMAFITGSLRKIGQDFGLPISKGDFPHNFSRPHNQQYVGSIPPLHTPEDYFCLNSKRSQEEIDEMIEWHARESTIYCTCGENCIQALEQCGACLKRLWVFRDKLVEYCWLDVDVLAEVCKQYREVILTPSPPEEAEEGWNYPGLDPFSMLTMSQIGITAFMNGHVEDRLLFNSQFSDRAGYNCKSNEWLYDIWNRRYNRENKVIYKGTSLKEWYCMETESYYPGYCPETNTIFIFHDCAHQKCRECYHETDESKVMERRRMRDRTVLQVHYRIEEIWEHEFDHWFVYPGDAGINHRKIMEDRSFFYGGRTEVFSPYMTETEEFDIKYMDVTSLYPTVCAGGGGVDDHGQTDISFDLPVDEPIVIHMPDLARCSPYADNPYWGFVYCKVIPNKACLLGLLPGRDAETGRLQFTLADQEGCWHTEELYLAIRNGYVVAEIYQVFHWVKEARSNTYMRGYVAFFLRMKQEADGWKKAGGTSENPTEEEKVLLIENLFKQNGNIARMRSEKVFKSPVKRQIAKLFLNSLWGKYAQKKQDDYFITINGYQQYMQFINHPIVDREHIWFRHVKENMFKVRYHRLTGSQTPNAKYNIFLAASVTAHARCYLHRNMLKIGPEKMGYADTDSIIFFNHKDPAKTFVPGVGLGKWTDEYPNKIIKKLYALAPKSYNLEFDDGGHALKSKGISLTLQNQNLVHHRLLGQMLESVFMVGKQEMPQVYLKHMNITANSHYASLPYATLMTINSEKIMRPVLTKRQIVHYDREDRQYEDLEQAVKRLYTVPIGFFRQEQDIAELIRRKTIANPEGVVCCNEIENVEIEQLD